MDLYFQYFFAIKKDKKDDVNFRLFIDTKGMLMIQIEIISFF